MRSSVFPPRGNANSVRTLVRSHQASGQASGIGRADVWRRHALLVKGGAQIAKHWPAAVLFRTSLACSWLVESALRRVRCIYSAQAAEPILCEVEL